MKRYLSIFSLSFLSSPVFAAVPAGVTTAISDAAEDVATIGAAVILVLIAVAAWKWLRRAM